MTYLDRRCGQSARVPALRELHQCSPCSPTMHTYAVSWPYRPCAVAAVLRAPHRTLRTSPAHPGSDSDHTPTLPTPSLCEAKRKEHARASDARVHYGRSRWCRPRPHGGIHWHVCLRASVRARARARVCVCGGGHLCNGRGRGESIVVTVDRLLLQALRTLHPLEHLRLQCAARALAVGAERAPPDELRIPSPAAHASAAMSAKAKCGFPANSAWAHSGTPTCTEDEL